MPLLGGLMVSLFSGLSTFLIKFLGVRLAAIGAAVGTFTALNAALFVAAGLLVNSLELAFPSIVLTGVWLMLPDNLVACFAIIASCDAMCAIYRFNAASVKLAASVS